MQELMIARDGEAAVWTSVGKLVVTEQFGKVVCTMYPKDPNRTIHKVRETGGEVEVEYCVGRRPPVLNDEVTMRDESGVMRTFVVQGVRAETDGTIKIKDERGAWLRWEEQ